ncbi:hypothetical protein AB0I54_02085 [Streptomyces sp. NPDC050625]|uniref:hypothetical protein n=1 Tax=Streptomyces sp. NPDC050625 TaxID=3154629 RepID=UPI00341D9F68
MTVFCLPGDEATGGGFNGPAPVVETSRPIPSSTGVTPIGWQVTIPPGVALPPTAPPTFDAYVVCNNL